MISRTAIIILALCLVTASAFAADASSKKKSGSEQGELMTRIDFGNSYITGQTLKSGAVYLLQRKKSEVKSMLYYREHYRKEILESHDIIDDFKQNKQDKQEK